jgi:hypothetical protein
VLLALGIAGLAAAPNGAAPDAPDAPLTLGVAGRSNAHVSLAAEGRFVVAVWSASARDGATDIYSAVSRDAGAAFSAPIRVNSTIGDARVNGEQPPRAALTPRRGSTPVITVVWTARGASGTTLQTARSDDAGRTFGRSAIVPGTDTAGNRGWEAIAADDRGAVHVVWLDHRRLAAAAGQKVPHTSGPHHGQAASPAAKHDGVAMAQLSQLYIATLDGAAAPRGITGGVCYCCKTALATGSNGAVYAAWRHVYPGNLRDIAFASSSDAGRTFGAPVRVSEDKWQLDGCPDDGPAMAVDGQRTVHLAWPTLVSDGKQPTIGLFYASSSDGSRFSQRLRIPTEGLPHHPQIALTPDSVLAAWDELSNGSRQVVIGRAARQNSRGGFARRIVPGSTTGIYPSIVSTSDGAVVAWSSGVGATAAVKLIPLPRP